MKLFSYKSVIEGHDKQNNKSLSYMLEMDKSIYMYKEQEVSRHSYSSFESV